jgi:putative ABC transport system permease protein
MFKHLFKLTWNKKKQNFLLIMEIFLSFIGLFAGFTAILYPINNFKLPLGFETENVWVVNFSNVEEIKNIDSLQVYRESIKTTLRSMDGVEDVSFTSMNVPLSSSRFTLGTNYKGKKAWGSIYTVEDNYSKLLGVQVLEGRWFSGNDVASKERPVIINSILKKQLFGEENALGKIVESDDAIRMKIIGVVASFKEESEAEQPTPGLFVRMDTSNMRNYIAMLIKVKPGSDAIFESKVHKTLSNTMRDANVEIKHLTEMKDARNRGLRVPLIIFCIIAIFLIVNVALGIFGVLWYNINKRKGEIGLRRAVGATGNNISNQLVGEAFVLCSLSIVLGLFFAAQFPLLGALQLPVENYVQAIIIAIVFIYALVLICALYPGKQAARIYPAVALHED